MIRAGRPDKGMPPFTISDADLIAIVAFIHDTKMKAETLGGGRRSVDVTDLATGSADAGKAYFNGAGGCATCPSIDRRLRHRRRALSGTAAAAAHALSRLPARARTIRGPRRR